MIILSDKVVITRKPHHCSACGRKFEKGIKMRVQVNTAYGINTWRECPTCTELLKKHRANFADCYNICELNCIDESLSKNQTPEQLLFELNLKQQ